MSNEYKPKVPNKEKVASLCATLPTKDAIVPIAFHILQRYLEKEQPANDMETKLF